MSDTHEGLMRSLRNLDSKEASRCAAALKSMKRWRIQADYEDVFEGDLRKSAEFALQQARWITQIS
jgi:hypothetical protein